MGKADPNATGQLRTIPNSGFLLYWINGHATPKRMRPRCLVYPPRLRTGHGDVYLVVTKSAAEHDVMS